MFLDEAQRLKGQDTLDVLWGDKSLPFRTCSVFFLFLKKKCALAHDVCAHGCSNVCASTYVWKLETQHLWPFSILYNKAGY